MSGGIVFTVYENMIDFLAFMDPGNIYIWIPGSFLVNLDVV